MRNQILAIDPKTATTAPYDPGTHDFFLFLIFRFFEMVQNRVFRQNHYQIRIPRRILGIIKQIFMYSSSCLTFFYDIDLLNSI